MLKKVLIAFAVLVVVLVVAAVALVTLVDVDRFKPQIQQAVADRYGRTLTIDGKLSLSVLPRIAVALPATRLSEPGSTNEAARLASAKVSVALWPLLRGRIVADRIAIDGLSGRIERRVDGTTSIDDLIGRSAAAPKDTNRPAGAPATIPAFDIGGVELSNAKLVFDDHKAGGTTTIDRLDLRTGRLANQVTTPIVLSLSFAGTKPQASGTVEVKGDVALDLDTGRHGARGLGAVVHAVVGATTIDAKIEAGEVNGASLSITRVAVEATSTEGAHKVVARLTTPAKGDLSAGTWQFAPLAGQVVIEDPRITSGRARVDVSGNVSADTNKESLRADLAAKGEGTSLSAKVALDGFTARKITFDVSADQFDLDRFVAADKPAAGRPVADRPPTAGNEEPIDLSVLRNLNVDGRMAIAALRARGLAASNVGITLKAAGGRLDAAPISADLYGGRLAARAAVHAGATAPANRIELDADLAGISIGPLLRELANKDMLEGRGNVKLALRTGGATGSVMKRALGGTLAVALRDGSIKGINLGETMRNARNLLRVGGNNETRDSDVAKKTDFTEMTMTATITDGIARSSDLEVKSPLLRIGGEGSANLVASSLDYTVRASIVGTSTGQDGKELEELRGVTIPVRLTGPFSGPKWQIDWASAGRDALKSRAAAELRERLKTDELRDKATEKARERVGDALKGLLGR